MESLRSSSKYGCYFIKTVDISTLYTSIPHTLLQSMNTELIQCCFSKKNGKQRYQCLVTGRDTSYFVKSHSKSNNNYKQDEIIQMLDCFINNICVMLGGLVFQQTIDIPKDTNCAPLLTDLFLHADEADVLQMFFKNKDRKLAHTFNSVIICIASI